MTKEDKDLLIKDLCARLPYGVKCKICREGFEDYPAQIVRAIYDTGTCYFDYGVAGKTGDIEYSEVKPYLRPMSSMTKEERNEWEFICSTGGHNINEGYVIESMDWLNFHHFDYRGLIEKGLALPAPPDMYKID